MERRWTLLLLIATSVAFAAAVSAPLYAGPFVPAFQQDWVWPINEGQLAAFGSQGVHAWLSSGLGGPLVYPTTWWGPELEALACRLFGVESGLAAYLFFWMSLSGIGLSIALLQMRVSYVGAFFAVACFAGNPVVLNEIQAGHLNFIVAYAMLPWILTLAMREGWRATLLLGLLVGLSAIQQQFLVFSLGLAFAISITVVSPRTLQFWMRVAAIAIIAAAVSAPSWIGAATFGTSSLSPLDALLAWERVQSSPLPSALRLLGYQGGYDARLISQAAQAALWVLPALAVVGLVSAFRSRFTNIIGAIAVLSVVATSGLKGPGSVVVQFMFLHVNAATLFRELYNFSALTVLALSILAAAGLEWIARKPRLLLPALSLSMVSALFVFLPIARAASEGIPRITPAMLTAADSLRTTHRGYRFIALPGLFPITARQGEAGGLSPFLLPQGGYASSALTPNASYPETLLIREAELEPAAEQTKLLMSRAGVGAIVKIPGLYESQYWNIEPRLRPLVASPKVSTIDAVSTMFPSAGARLVIEPFSAQPGTLGTAYTGARDIRATTPEANQQSPNLAQHADPRNGWARTDLWPNLPTWSYRMPLNVFTMRDHIVARAPAGSYIVGSSGAHLLGSRCKRTLRLDRYWRVFTCHADPAFVGKAPILLSSVEPNALPAKRLRQEGSFGKVLSETSGSASINATIIANRGSAVVLRDRFDPGWKIDVAARHVEVDGYANGWVLTHDIDRTVHIWYAPQFERSAAIVTSILAMLLAIGAAFYYRPRGSVGTL